MKVSNKILYFLMGALFAGMIGWNFSRPVEAVAPTTVERKVTVLSAREVARMEKDIAGLEQSIQEDREFLAGNAPSAGGKGGWSSQQAERKNSIEQNLPAKERRLADIRAQLQTLRM